ncbi:hypothetical protein, partial [Streptococcus danieliae]|uniref:hypothetical protein n=1 Tax=Streptococcus danieliae TaxID=747656 RepID=UPI0021C5E199
LPWRFFFLYSSIPLVYLGSETTGMIPSKEPLVLYPAKDKLLREKVTQTLVLEYLTQFLAISSYF